MKRSKEIILGLLGLATVAVLYYGISFLKGKNLFSTQKIYYVSFENAGGLTKSSPVYADGYSVGIVNDIVYNYQSQKNVVVEISLDDDMRIPVGTQASLEKEMLGTIKMHLLLANNPRHRVEPGDTIKGFVDSGLMGTAEKILPQFEKLLPKLDSILASVNSLLSDPALQNILHNTDHMTTNLNKASAKLDHLLGVEIPEFTKNIYVMSQHVNTMVDDLDHKINQIDVNALMDRVNTTLSNVETVTNKLNNKDNTVGLLLNDPTLYNNLTETSANASNLLKDLQTYPKRYVHFSLFGRKDRTK